MANKFFSRLMHRLDPRPMLASQWLESAEKYEERLRANPSLDGQVVETIIQERNRIGALFKDLLPEFSGRISVVVTMETRVENCAVFVWQQRLYILVSAALVARPYDYPEDAGHKAWEWLARHEAAHVRGGHLPWLFYTRRMFQFACNIGVVSSLLLGLFASKQTLYAWLEPSVWVLGALWFFQTIVALACEWKADLIATRSVGDPSVLQEAEKTLARMGLQARGCRPFPWGWIQYAISLVFVDPHPPFLARRWLLQRGKRGG